MSEREYEFVHWRNSLAERVCNWVLRHVATPDYHSFIDGSIRLGMKCAALHRHDDHVCDTGDFDRTICPEPCGSMHSYCSTCGKRQDQCQHEKQTR